MRRSPHLLLLLALAMGVAQCSLAPRPQEARGEIARAIEQGITSGRSTFDHARFDALLRATVNQEQNRVDYAALKKREAELDAYLGELARANLGQLSRGELLALLINAYNAYTLKTIVKTITPARPRGVASIRDIPSVFKAAEHTVGGFRLSLDNIEHNILRPIFKDPRIHFAVSCASVSCPPLASRAYTGARVGEELEEAARRTLESPRYARVERNRLLLTKVMDWYGRDFVTAGYLGAEKTLTDYVARYARADVREFIARQRPRVPIEFLDYDWSLNRAD
jgi:hypothetical protein